MPPPVRKLVLSVHIAVSVGWLGAVVAYLVLDVVAATSRDASALSAAYVAMGLLAGRAIVPLALAALLTGLAVSLGTSWGLFRHWWVLISFVLTLLAVLVLLVELRAIDHFARIAADPATSAGDLRALGGTLLHSVGGALVLLVILVLNVYKPQGLTLYGWRRQQAGRPTARTTTTRAYSSMPTDRTP